MNSQRQSFFNWESRDIYSNPVIFVIFWVPVCQGKLYVVLRPVPNHQNKQMENTIQVFIFYTC